MHASDPTSTTTAPEIQAEVRSESRLWTAVVQRRAQIAKSAAGLALLSLAAWSFQRHVLSTTSEEAVVTAEFIDVVAPIEGFVAHGPIRPGTVFGANDQLTALHNPLADRTAVTELEARLAVLDGDIQGLRQVIDALSRLGGRFRSRGDTYQQRRSQELALQLAQARARSEADEARLAESKQRLERAESLSKLGLVSLQGAEEARRDATVSEKAVAASQREAERLSASLEALKQGFSLGEFSAMDKSYSSQRSDDIGLRLAQLRGDLAQKLAARPAVAAELEAQRDQLTRLSEAHLSVPRRARVWSLGAADGVFVSRGTSLLRLVDCSQVRVIAYLTERSYNRLRLGTAAEIRLLPGDQRYAGKVDLRLGSADLLLSVGTATSLPPNQRERFAVAVSSTALGAALREECETGQNAEVTFLDHAP